MHISFYFLDGLSLVAVYKYFSLMLKKERKKEKFSNSSISTHFQSHQRPSQRQVPQHHLALQKNVRIIRKCVFQLCSSFRKYCKTLPPSLPPSLPLSLSPSLPLSLSPSPSPSLPLSLPLSLAPSLPRSLPICPIVFVCLSTYTTSFSVFNSVYLVSVRLTRVCASDF